MKFAKCLILAASVLSIVTLSSCNKEGKEPERNRPFNYDVVKLCKSYLNMDKVEAALKIQEDFDYTAGVSGGDDGNIHCMPNGESITAVFENGKVYRVDYSRNCPFEYSEMMKIAKKVCTELNNYYDNDNKTGYTSGEVYYQGEEHPDFYYSHADFMNKWNSSTKTLYRLEEKWGKYSKHWYFCPTSDGKEYVIDFCIDLGAN